MSTLMIAALVALQPAPAANPQHRQMPQVQEPHAQMPHGQMPHGQAGSTQHPQAQGMMASCPCCRNMGQHGAAATPNDGRGQ